MKVFRSSAFISYLSKQLFKILCLVSFSVFLSLHIFAQSSDQNFPTPITTNQIDGSIKARDIGDSRLTTYYYVFTGNRGDIFINVVSSNFNGDIDVFTAQGLRPRTKITLFADNESTETGRVIYMRQAEKLILRIQGRSPNDDAAQFVIKFAGSFELIQAVASNVDLKAPKVSDSNKEGIKVNSVGTIIKPIPTPTPVKTEVIADIKVDSNDKSEVVVSRKDVDEIVSSEDIKTDEKVSDNETDVEIKDVESTTVKPDIPTVFDPTKKLDDILKEANKAEKPRLLIIDPFKAEQPKAIEKLDANEDVESFDTNITLEIKDKPKNNSTIVRIERVFEEDETTSDKAEENANPLAKVFLTVELKNGDKFQRSMVEVLSMNVIKGVLTIVTNDGKIQEYSILDVVKMTIQ